MRYAQQRAGQKLHMVFEAGEQTPSGGIVRSGYVSGPLCGKTMRRPWRLTINWPMAMCCKLCSRRWRSLRRKQEGS